MFSDSNRRITLKYQLHIFLASPCFGWYGAIYIRRLQLTFSLQSTSTSITSPTIHVPDREFLQCCLGSFLTVPSAGEAVSSTLEAGTDELTWSKSSRIVVVGVPCLDRGYISHVLTVYTDATRSRLSFSPSPAYSAQCISLHHTSPTQGELTPMRTKTYSQHTDGLHRHPHLLSSFWSPQTWTRCVQREC